MITKNVLALIDAERRRQEYSLQYADSHDDGHGPTEWVVLLGTQLGDMAHNAWQRHDESYDSWIARVERPLIQLVAVGVAALESFARCRTARGSSHALPDDEDPRYQDLPWPIVCQLQSDETGCAASSFIANINVKRSFINSLSDQLEHAGRLMDEQRWWLDRKSREMALLRRELAACAQALEFVEQSYPDLPGSPVRQMRIGKAHALLTKVSPNET